ncbi:MAG: InlB B-repeat-containing protein [Bacillota bacterium]
MERLTKTNKVISIILVLALLLSLFSGVTITPQTAFAEEATDDSGTATIDDSSDPTDTTGDDTVATVEPIYVYYSDSDGTDAPTTALVGSGTEDSPFLISSVEDLYLINLLEEDNTAGNAYYFKQTKNIDMSDIANLSVNAISYLHYQEAYYYIDQTFHGVYDGGNYTISNMTKPLFQYIEGESLIGESDNADLDFYNSATQDALDIVTAGIFNLVIEDATIQDFPSEVGSEHLSAIAITSYNTAIVGVDFIGGEITSTGYHVSSFIGYASGYLLIEDCNMESTTVSTVGLSAGGLVNESYGQTFIYNINIDDDCVISSPATTGGLIRIAGYSIFSECENYATIVGQNVGGLVGYLNGLVNIDNCTVAGSLSFSDSASNGYIGGAIYRAEGTVATLDCDVDDATFPSVDYENSQYVATAIGYLYMAEIYSLDFNTEKNEITYYGFQSATNTLVLSGSEIVAYGETISLVEGFEISILKSMVLYIEDDIPSGHISVESQASVYTSNKNGVDITAGTNIKIYENTGTLGDLKASEMIVVGVSDSLDETSGNSDIDAVIGDITAGGSVNIYRNLGTIGKVTSESAYVSIGQDSVDYAEYQINSGTIGSIDAGTSVRIYTSDVNGEIATGDGESIVFTIYIEIGSSSVWNGNTIGDSSYKVASTGTSSIYNGEYGVIGDIINNSTYVVNVYVNEGTIGDVSNILTTVKIHSNDGTIGDLYALTTVIVGSSASEDETSGNGENGKINSITAGTSTTIYRNLGTIGDVTSGTYIRIGQDIDDDVIYELNTNSGTIGSLDAGTFVQIYTSDVNGEIATGEDESIVFTTYIQIGSSSILNGNTIGDSSSEVASTGTSSICNGEYGDIGDITVNTTDGITVKSNAGTIGNITNKGSNVTVGSSNNTDEAVGNSNANAKIGDITSKTQTIIYRNLGTIDDVNADTYIQVGQSTATSYPLNNNYGTIGDLTSVTYTYIYTNGTGSIGAIDAGTIVTVGSANIQNYNTIESISAVGNVTIGTTGYTNKGVITNGVLSAAVASGYSDEWFPITATTNKMVFSSDASSGVYQHTSGGTLEFTKKEDGSVEVTDADAVVLYTYPSDSAIYLSIMTADVTGLIVNSGVEIETISAINKISKFYNYGAINEVFGTTVTLSSNTGTIGTISGSAVTVTNTGTIKDIIASGNFTITNGSTEDKTGAVGIINTITSTTASTNAVTVTNYGNITDSISKVAGTGALTVYNYSTMPLSCSITNNVGLLTLTGNTSAVTESLFTGAISTNGSLTLAGYLSTNVSTDPVTVTLTDQAMISAATSGFYLEVLEKETGDIGNLYLNMTSTTDGNNTIDVTALSNATLSGETAKGTVLVGYNDDIVAMTSASGTITETITGDVTISGTTVTIGSTENTGVEVGKGKTVVLSSTAATTLTNYGTLGDIVYPAQTKLTIINYGTIGSVTAGGAVTISENTDTIGSVDSGGAVTITSTSSSGEIATGSIAAAVGESIKFATSIDIGSSSAANGYTIGDISYKEGTSSSADNDIYNGTGTIGDITVNSSSDITIVSNAGTIGNVKNDTTNVKVTANAGTIGSLTSKTTMPITSNTGKIGDVTAGTTITITSNTGEIGNLNAGTAITITSSTNKISEVVAGTTITITSNTGEIGDLDAGTTVTVGASKSAIETTGNSNVDAVIKNINAGTSLTIYRNLGKIGNIVAQTSITIGQNEVDYMENQINSGTIGSLDAGLSVAIYTADEGGSIATAAGESITIVSAINIGSSNIANGNDIGDVSYKEGTSATSTSSIYNGAGIIGDISVNTTNNMAIESNAGKIGDVRNDNTNVNIRNNTGEIGNVTAATAVVVGNSNTVDTKGNDTDAVMGSITAGTTINVYRNLGTIGDLTAGTYVSIGQGSADYMEYQINSGTIGSVDAGTYVAIYTKDTNGEIATGADESITFTTYIDIGTADILNGNTIGDISYKEGISSTVDNDIYNGESGVIGDITVNSSTDISIQSNAGTIGTVTNVLDKIIVTTNTGSIDNLTATGNVNIGVASSLDETNGNSDADAEIGNIVAGANINVYKNVGKIGNLESGSGYIVIGENSVDYASNNNNSGSIGQITTSEGVELVSIAIADNGGTYASEFVFDYATATFYFIDSTSEYDIELESESLTVYNMSESIPTVNVTSGGNVTNVAYVDEDNNSYYAAVNLFDEVDENSTVKLTGDFASLYLVGPGTTVSYGGTVGILVKANASATYYAVDESGMISEVGEGATLSTKVVSEGVLQIYMTTDGNAQEGTITLFASEGTLSDQTVDFEVADGVYLTYLTDIEFTEPDFYDNVTISAIHTKNVTIQGDDGDEVQSIVSDVTYEFSTIVKETAVETYVYDGEVKAYVDLGGKYIIAYYQGTTLKTDPTAVGSYDVTIFNMADTSSYYKIEGGLVIEAADTLEISAENALMFVGDDYEAEVTGAYGDDVIDVVYSTTDGTIDDFATLPAGTYEVTVTATNANYVTKTKVVEVELVDKYTVEFNTNNVSVSATAESATTGLDGTLSELPTISDNSYIFLGWYTDAIDGDLVTTAEVYEGNTTLYAHWQEVSEATTYKLNYDANGGEGTMDGQTIVGGIDIQVSANGFEREGYKFLGWSESATEEASVTDQATYTVGDISENVTLFAIWQEKTAVSIDETANASVSYDGDVKVYAISGDNSEIGFVVEYYVSDEETPVADPTDVGSYDVVISRDEDETYKAYEKTITAGLVITQATNEIADLSIVGWTYGETANAPTIESALFGAEDIVYTYEISEGTEYVATETVSDAGSYKVTATIAGTDNYSETTATATFTIEKADPTVPTGLYATAGDKLSSVELPDGWAWDLEGTTVIAIDTTYKATYVEDDNYLGVTSADVGMTIYSTVESSDDVSADDLAEAYEIISSASENNAAYSTIIDGIVAEASTEAEIVEIAELLENMVTETTSNPTAIETLTYGENSATALKTATVEVAESDESTTSITITTSASDATGILVTPGVVSSATGIIENDMASGSLTDVNGDSIDLSEHEITTFDYTIKVVRGSTDSEITQVTIAFEGEEGATYYVAHVKADGETVEYLPATYDHAAKTLTFTTTSFSPFVVLAVPVTTSTSTSSSSSSSGSLNIDSSAPTMEQDGDVVTVYDANLSSITVNGVAYEFSGSTVEIDLSDLGDGDYEIVATDKYKRTTTISASYEAPIVTPTVTETPTATETPVVTETPTETTSSSNAWIWILVAVIAIGGIAGFVIYKKKKQS